MKHSFYGRLRAQGYDIGTDVSEIMRFYVAQWDRLGRPQPTPRLFEEAPAPAEPLPDRLDAVLVDGRWPRAAVAALEAARGRGIPGLADLDHPMAEPWAGRLLAAASHVCFSRDGLSRWTGEAAPEVGLERIAARTTAALAVTLGGAGALLLEDGRAMRLPAFPVRAVDTLGAGDTFHGALAVALAERRPWRPALRFAGAAAALRCARPGGRDAFPTRAEVEALLAGSDDPATRPAPARPGGRSRPAW